MKTNVLSFTIKIVMAGIVLTSCGQTSKQDAKIVKEDAKELHQDLKQGAIDTNNEIKNQVQSEWQSFKTTSENTIEVTNNQIQELRVKIEKANATEKAKLTATLDKLEQKNNELKVKLAERSKAFKEDMITFNESAKNNEKEFEREFTHDMSELGTALKDLFKNNVE